MQAIIKDNFITVQSVEYLPDGVTVAVVSCLDHSEFKVLPCAIEYNGNGFALSGWNSDRFIAYYRTDRYHSLASIL